MSNPRITVTGRTFGRAGHIAAAVLSGLYEAVPDYLQKKTAKRLVRSGLAAAIAAALATSEFSPFEDSDGDGESDLKEALNSAFETAADTMEADELSPALTLAILAALIAPVAGVIMWLDDKSDKLLGATLRRLGIPKPHTAIGIATAAGMYLYLENTKAHS